MKKRILRYFKHLFVTILFLAISATLFGLYHGASLHYGDHPKMYQLEGDGPYVFYTNDSTLQVNYIKGNQDDGFYTEQTNHSSVNPIAVHCSFPLEESQFNFTIQESTIKTPKARYHDNHPILAISDIESSYKTFRDFLIANNVINNNLDWIFGKGHLVLVGDFVDRGNSTTQVLWFIYKLEQDAAKKGGKVHFIIGNHELKNFQGNHESASPKYNAIANILHKQQSDLYAPESFLGKWLSGKNAIELINGHLFAHGGLHPDIANTSLSLEDINQTIRENYYRPYFPKPDETTETLLTSTKTGICWYRGYFKDDLAQSEVDGVLQKFGAKSVIVGHTLQSTVKQLYNGSVIAIDVKHPNDYHKNWPHQDSEGLLIENGKHYKLYHDGSKVAL